MKKPVSDKGSKSYDANFYKVAYSGYELLDNYTSTELERYRALLIKKTRPQVEFIEKELKDIRSKRALRVIEYCSGNGRLLLCLAKEGALEFGLGIEISSSRVEFAEKWRQDCGVENLTNISVDVLECSDYPREYFDLSVCITGAFQYFRPIDEDAPAELLEKMRVSLRPGGKALLEMYQLTGRRRQILELHDGKLREWEELAPHDSFRFYLNDFTYLGNKNILKHEKIFIGRNGTIDEGRVHVVTYYTASQIKELMNNCGFTEVRVFENFDGDSYCEGLSESMVVVGTRTQ